MKLEDIKNLLNQAYHKIDPEEPDPEQQYYNKNINQIRYALDNGLLKPEEIQGEDVLYKWIIDGIDDNLVGKIQQHRNESRKGTREKIVEPDDNDYDERDKEDKEGEGYDLDDDWDEADRQDYLNYGRKPIELNEQPAIFLRVKNFLAGLWNNGKEWIKKTFGNKSRDEVLTIAEVTSRDENGFKDGIVNPEAAAAVYDVAEKYHNGELATEQALQNGNEEQSI